MKPLNKLLRCFFAFLLSAMILYADILFSFPSELTLHLNQLHRRHLGAGVCLGNFPDNICAASDADTVTPLKAGSFDATLKIADIIPYRKIRLTITSEKNLHASGELIGIRIFSKGLIVTNLSPIKNDKRLFCPAQEAGIRQGDIITEINGASPESSEDVPGLLSENTTIGLLRDGKKKTISIRPVKDESDGKLKIGVWVRDSTAGVGTMTYYNSDNFTYGALGHGISDSDTGVSFNVGSGTIEKSHVLSLTKGKKGTPGQICGSFSSEHEIEGTILQNCASGIFGNLFPHSSIEGKSYPIGLISQVRPGKATILSTVDESIKEYEIRILRTMPYQSATKGLAIEITDQELLEKTGGIVQGMSGSPILQNGRIVGAVTHVFVNDPTRGYGIFIENMLSEAEKIK